MEDETTRRPWFECEDCREPHQGGYSHQGQFDDRAYYEVYCPESGFSAFSNTELEIPAPSQKRSRRMSFDEGSGQLR